MGQTLARIHTLPLPWRPVRDRRQHHIPVVADGNPLPAEISDTAEWLRGNRPSPTTRVFVHGDYHYANLLWEGQSVSAILDWELCGMGWREFDLAWATTLRPSQTFLTTEAEVQAFLDGYRQLSDCDDRAFRWCRALIYCHFLSMRDTWDDEMYKRAAFSVIEGVRGRG